MAVSHVLFDLPFNILELKSYSYKDRAQYAFFYLGGCQMISSRLPDDKALLMLMFYYNLLPFDIVNVDLLIRRLTVAGLPSDIIHLISIWPNTPYVAECHL